jgi:hypothetical protein
VRGHDAGRGRGRWPLFTGVSSCVLISSLFLVGTRADAHRDTGEQPGSALHPLSTLALPAACTDPKDRPAEHTTVQTGQNPVCGTLGNDWWQVPKNVDNGVAIWGYEGNDRILARNGKSESIFGGKGADEGWFDPCDHVASDVEKRHVSKKPCPGVKKKSKRRRGLRAQGIVYPLPDAGIIECTLDLTGRRLVRVSQEPQMRAVDATPQVDYQFVAYSPALYRLDGSQWTFVAQDPWLWDYTYDQQVAAFAGNFWRRLDNNQRWFLWFYPQGPGIYRVDLQLKWYAQGRLPVHEESRRAHAHYGPFEVRAGELRHHACEYPS